LHKALEELRSVYDKKMQQSSEDFAKMYDERVRDLQTQLSKERHPSFCALEISRSPQPYQRDCFKDGTTRWSHGSNPEVRN